MMPASGQGVLPTWTMTGTPSCPAASTARRVGSMPLSPTRCRPCLTLMPVIRSRFPATADTERSTSTNRRLASSGVPAVGMPTLEMLEKPKTRVREGSATLLRKASWLGQLELPASTMAVTPVEGQTSSGTRPMSVNPQQMWACRSTRPGKT